MQGRPPSCARRRILQPTGSADRFRKLTTWAQTLALPLPRAGISALASLPACKTAVILHVSPGVGVRNSSYQVLTTVPCASPSGRRGNRGSKRSSALGPGSTPARHPRPARGGPCLALPATAATAGIPAGARSLACFGIILGRGPSAAGSPPRAPRRRRRAALGPPSLPTNFGQSGRGGGGALRAGGESARRNARDALFPAWRPNVLGPGRGGV